MIHKIKRNIKTVEKKVDEATLEKQGSLFSVVLSIVAVIAIARVVIL